MSSAVATTNSATCLTTAVTTSARCAHLRYVLPWPQTRPDAGAASIRVSASAEESVTRIYTKTGDRGETGLSDGSRVAKSDPRIVATGEIDELNACLGLASSLLGDDVAPESRRDLDSLLRRVQRDLFALGAILADPRRDGEDPDVAD